MQRRQGFGRSIVAAVLFSLVGTGWFMAKTALVFAGPPGAASSAVESSDDVRSRPVANVPLGDVDQPNIELKVLGKAQERLQEAGALESPGSPGTGIPIPAAERAADLQLTNAEIDKLPTIESVLGIQPESVCGTDTRIRVTTTTSFPWRANCHLIITLSNGQLATGTGWMVGRGTVITAGHCVHTGGAGGTWMRSITVIPGRNGTSRPYGSIASTRLRSVTGWTSSGSAEYDIGAILLPANQKVGDQTGFYGFAAYSNTTLNNMLVNTAGYPGDKTSGTQWRTSGNLSSVTTRRLFYNMDTFGGQSGSIVYRYIASTNQRFAVGIHAYGGCPNGATRITTGLFNTIQAWKNLTN